MTSTENEPIQQDSRMSEVAGHALAAAMLAAETPAQLDNQIADVNEVLVQTGLPEIGFLDPEEAVKLVQAENRAALQEFDLLPGINDEVYREKFLDEVLAYDKRVSVVTHDDRTPAEKGREHFRRLSYLIVKARRQR